MSDLQSITLGGGCFWCTEAVFDRVRGVTDVQSGYANGDVAEPTYEQVCSGTTGHAEVVRVTFDPAQIGVREILEIFFATHDPTQLNRQGNDVGTQYRSAIFPVDAKQHEAAAASLARFQERLREAGYGEIATEISDDQTFYYAEDEHQQYLDKNPDGYCPNHATGVRCGPRD